MKIRKDDTVVVLSGRDKGTKGKVLSVDPKAGKLIVENDHSHRVGKLLFPWVCNSQCESLFECLAM